MMIKSFIYRMYHHVYIFPILHIYSTTGVIAVDNIAILHAQAKRFYHLPLLIQTYIKPSSYFHTLGNREWRISEITNTNDLSVRRDKRA